MSNDRWRPSAGDRYGRWTVAEGPSVPLPRWRHAVPVVCDCGTARMVVTGDLRRGHSRSCGCLSADTTRALTPVRLHPSRREKIGDTPERLAIKNARGRCYNQNDKRFSAYGGRGIGVCERWRGPDGTANFIADMGPRPAGTTLDRIDVNGNYEPGNCRWATAREQLQNLRATVRISHDGRTMTAEEWAAKTGISQRTLTARIRRGWDHSRAVTQPVLAAAKGAGR